MFKFFKYAATYSKRHLIPFKILALSLDTLAPLFLSLSELALEVRFHIFMGSDQKLNECCCQCHQIEMQAPKNITVCPPPPCSVTIVKPR